MKLALVHDDLVQWGGAERVLLALSEAFPEAPIYTSVFDRKNPLLKEKFAGRKIVTSFIQRIPGWRKLYKALLPLYPIAFEQFDFSGFDVVLSQTTRFAKAVITKPETKHICYCHTPPRFLWNFAGGKNPSGPFGYFNFLRRYDKAISRRPDLWVAGSKNARERLAKVYGVSSRVIYPFVDIEQISPWSSWNGGYLMVVSRLNDYKRIDLVIQAANALKISLKVVGEGPMKRALQGMGGPTVEFLGRVEEELLVLLLSGCKALVIAGEEDFGMAALEAQSFGKPVLAYGRGGSLETIIDGETGSLFGEQTVESLSAALADFDEKTRQVYNEVSCRKQAAVFSKDSFFKNFRDLVNS